MKTLTETQLSKILNEDRATLIKTAPPTGNQSYWAAQHLSYHWYEILKAISGCLSSSRARAKQYNWQYNLHLKYMAELYIDQKGLCPLTGQILSPYSGDWNQKNPYKISIDRIDSSKGYVRGNVILVTHWANNAKNTWPSEILESFIMYSYKQLKKNGR